MNLDFLNNRLVALVQHSKALEQQLHETYARAKEIKELIHHLSSEQQEANNGEINSEDTQSAA